MNDMVSKMHNRVFLDWFFVLVAVFMVGTTLFLGMVCTSDNLVIGKNEYGQVADVWTTDTGEEVSFPATITIGDEGISSLSCTLPEDIPDGYSVVYDAHYCGQEVYVDGELVYSFAAEPTMPFGKTRGNARVLVPLQPEDGGKTMTIVMTNPFGTNDTTIEGVYYGPAGEFKFALLHENLGRIFMAAAIVAIAFMMLIFGFLHVFSHAAPARTFAFFYFSFLAYAVAVWMLTDVSVVQLFTSKTVVAQYLAFLCLIGIGTFSMGLCSCLLPGKAGPFHGMEFLGYIFMLFYFLLYVTNVADLTSTMYVVCVYGVACVAYAFVLCLMEFRKNNTAKVLCLGQAVLLAGVGIAIVSMLSDPMNSGSMWPIVGAYNIYLFLLFLLLMQYEQNLLDQSNKTGAYWKMAYTDRLTGIANRAALEQIFDAMEARREENHEILFFMADLNGLKKTNDEQGHAAGDALIKATADCFGAVFYKDTPDGRSALSFRLGGDEFAAIVVDSYKPVSYYYERLEEEMAKKRQAGINVSVAVGHAVCNYPKDGISLRTGLYRAADRDMYEHKVQMKAGRT